MHKKDGRKSIVIDLQEQVDTIAVNKAFSKVVTAGSKGLLKIYSIDSDGFGMLSDLRAVRSRRLNLMYSASHVAWSPTVENVIATTSTNGAVVLWNVQKSAMDHIYKAHTRSATKVCFHQTDRNILISGAKDAAVILYDLRIMEPAKKFLSASSDPVRDMQFGIHPANIDMFVAADDGGSVRFWDMRRHDRPLHQFVAHHGPSSIALNPNLDDQNLIATAGRDKFIRIWKWSDWSDNAFNSAMYSVETTASVAKVYWRPQNKYHVASCSVVNDINVHIWDIRRPFLPYASFDEHRDICSDLVWKPDDPDIFISAGKDGYLVMHFVENAHHPIDHVGDVAVDISPDGTVAIALSSQLSLKNQSLIELEKLQKGEAFVPHRRRYDAFQSSIPSHLICCEPTIVNKDLSPNQIISLAKKYKLFGDTTSALCFYNSNIAEEAGKQHIAHTWRTVGLLSSFTTFFDTMPSRKTSLSRHGSTDAKENVVDINVRSRFPSSLSSNAIVRALEVQEMNESNHLNIAYALPSDADLFFGDEELNVYGLTSDTADFAIPCDCEAPSYLRGEAFFMKPYEESESVDVSCANDSDDHSGAESLEDHENDSKKFCQMGKLSIKSDLACNPTWDPLPLIRSLFEFYAEMGDVQTCVSILLVLGDRSTELIDVATQKMWFFDYLEILDCYELWNTSAEIIKLCWIPASTSLRLICSKCKAVSSTVSPHCKKCSRKFNFMCSLCSLPVNGIWSWCRGCSHGGHPEHLAKWFSKNSCCPTGCGHSCVK